VGLIPKETSDPYFVAADKGAEEAAQALGMTLDYKGPVSLDPAGQIQVITQLAQEHVNALAISADDPNAIAPALKAATAEGVTVDSFDATAAADARQLFMEQPVPAELAQALVDTMESSVGATAKILLMTSTLQAPNQNAWVAAVEAYVAANYPNWTIQAVLPGQSDTSLSFNIAKTWLQAHPETTGILTVDGAELAGAAQAVNALNLKGKVTLVGIGVPSQNGPDILSGTVKAAILWNPIDIGYATVYMMHEQLCGTLHRGDKVMPAGRLGNLQFVADDTITLGKPLIFTAANVSQFNF
jgi:ABC-type sugar transport system substrate-binding protein